MESRYCVREPCLARIGETSMPGNGGEPIPVPAHCRLLEYGKGCRGGDDKRLYLRDA
jgi:hypothetical protein